MLGILLGVTIAASAASAISQHQANQQARRHARRQETITKAQAEANRIAARQQYEQAQDQAQIARREANFAINQAEESFALGMGSTASGYRQTMREIGFAQDQAKQQYQRGLESIGRARDNALMDVRQKQQETEAQLAAAGGRTGSMRSRLQENLQRARGEVGYQYSSSENQLETQLNSTMQKAEWAEDTALRMKRSGFIELGNQFEQTQNQYNKLMGGDGYGEGTIAERLQSARQQKNRVVGAGDYAASAANIDNYSGGFGTADLIEAGAQLRRQSVYAQTGPWSVITAGIQGGAQGASTYMNIYSGGRNLGWW